MLYVDNDAVGARASLGETANTWAAHNSYLTPRFPRPRSCPFLVAPLASPARACRRAPALALYELHSYEPHSFELRSYELHSCELRSCKLHSCKLRSFKPYFARRAFASPGSPERSLSGGATDPS